jgi:ribosomal protein L2
MSATKRYMNWTAVSFTPTGGSQTAITGVTSIAIDSGGTLARFSGDGDRYSTTVVNDHNEPVVTIHSADLAAIRANAVGVVGTFAATHNDARNGANAGAITYTLTNAVIANCPLQGAHRQFGQGTLTITAFSSDGITNPLSTTISP